jgi:hypothetical protein
MKSHKSCGWRGLWPLEAWCRFGFGGVAGCRDGSEKGKFLIWVATREGGRRQKIARGAAWAKGSVARVAFGMKPESGRVISFLHDAYL